jgi:hypothetical protein
VHSSSQSKLFVVLVASLLILYLTLDVMSSGGNVIGKIYFYVLIGSALFGLLAPRPALIYLFCLTAYLDTFKRFMILDSGVSMRDLYYVLGIAPATVGGIGLSLLNMAVQGNVPMAKKEGKWVIWIFGGQMIILGLSVMAVGKSARALGDAVNLAAYISMMFIIPLLYPSRADIFKLLKTILYILIPSAVYIIYQSFAGINSLELRYLKSGLTIEIKQLYEVKFRPFGTMNSASSASIVFAVAAVAAMVAPWGKRFTDKEGHRVMVDFAIPKYFIFLLFAVACFVTQGRTGWITALLGLGIGYVFRYRFLTLVTYSVALSGGLALIFGASWLLKNDWLARIDKWVLKYSDSAVTDRQLSVGSFFDRLSSFESLVNNRTLWTPLGWKLAGIPESKKPLIHDAITDMLVRFGYIPWSCIIVLVAVGVIKMHQIVLKQKNPGDKAFAAGCAACVFVLGLGCLSSWSQLFAFPINVYVWTFPALLAAWHFSEEKSPEAALQAGVEDMKEKPIGGARFGTTPTLAMR